MDLNPVLYSFGLYVLFVLLPLVPAVVIFLLFPEGNVQLEGPLQNLSVKATGAFAAYVVTVVLGALVVRGIEQQINLSRTYPFEGIITSLSPDQVFNYSGNFYAREYPAGPNAKDYRFVLLLPHPVDKPTRVWLEYWQTPASGNGGVPTPIKVPMDIVPTDSSPELFRLDLNNKQPRIVPESFGNNATINVK